MVFFWIDIYAQELVSSPETATGYLKVRSLISQLAKNILPKYLLYSFIHIHIRLVLPVVKYECDIQ